VAFGRCFGARLLSREKETALQPNPDVARWKGSVDQDHSGAGGGLDPAAHPVHREGLPRVHFLGTDCPQSKSVLQRGGMMEIGLFDEVKVVRMSDETQLAELEFSEAQEEFLSLIHILSMTFTTTLYEPDASYSYLVESSIFDSCRVRYDCH